MKKKVILAFVGPSASGKDTLARKVCNQIQYSGFNCGMVVKETSRPRRPQELNGIDYWFEDSKQEMLYKNYGKHYIGFSEYNGWCYGIPKKELKYDINIIVVDLKQLEDLIAYSKNFTIIPIYCKASLRTRIKRSKEREGKIKFEHFRRAISDTKNFLDISSYLTYFRYAIIINTKKDIPDNVNHILDYLTYWSIFYNL